jgi:hypothetical protein
MSNADAPAAAVSDGPEGIGGWLVLPILGLILTPLRGLFQLGQLADVKEALAYLTQAQIAFLVIETVLSVAIVIVLPIVLLVLVFRKKRAFPRFYVIWAVLCLLFIVGDLLVLQALFKDFFAAGGVDIVDQETLKDIGRAVALVAIWVPYMLNSRRVRNTFTQ